MPNSNLTMSEAFKHIENSFNSEEIKKILYKKMAKDKSPQVRVLLRDNTSYLLHYQAGRDSIIWRNITAGR